MTGYQFLECKRLEAPSAFSMAGGAVDLSYRCTESRDVVSAIGM
jgi:hypothetical protein